MKLNVKTCNLALPRAKQYKLTDGQGLILIITPGGSKFWRSRYRFNGTEKSFSHGPFPQVSLKEARLLNAQAKATIRQGIDPSATKQKEKRHAILNSANTFEALATEWHTRNIDTWDKRHGENILSRLKRDMFPIIGNTPIADLEAPDFSAAIKKIEDRGACETARRVLQTCGQVMRYAVQTGRAKHDTTSGLKGFLKRFAKSHYATIDVDELPILIRKIRHNDARLFKQTRIALEMMMLTFVRTSELINATWDEFNFEEKCWTIPPERMKMRREHIVPLSKQVCFLLSELHEISGRRDHLFPSIPRPRKAMSNATLLRALEKLGYHKIMTGHGFRALATTAIQEKLNYNFNVIDRQLAHKPKSRVDQAYDRAMFLDKRHQMMQDWADYIDKIALDEIIKPRPSNTPSSSFETRAAQLAQAV